MNTKRVFILGSGFSAGMGLPTLNNLFNDLMYFAEKPGYENDRRHILQALEFLYPHFKANITSHSYPPFEEFLTLVTMAKGLLIYDDNYWDQKEKSALKLLTDFFADKSKKAESLPLLETFTNNLTYGDVIVTFNWDNLVERSLLNQNKNVDFLERNGKAVTILKLHGSLNWWANKKKNALLKDPNSVLWLDDEIACTKDYSYYNTWIPLDEPPFIIPPVSSKDPLSDKFLSKIWHEAFNSLIEGNPICIIGYSLPKDDIHARILLRSGMLKEYRVIDPNPEISGRYFALINPNFTFHQSFFSKEIFSILFGQ